MLCYHFMYLVFWRYPGARGLTLVIVRTNHKKKMSWLILHANSQVTTEINTLHAFGCWWNLEKAKTKLRRYWRSSFFHHLGVVFFFLLIPVNSLVTLVLFCEGHITKGQEWVTFSAISNELQQWTGYVSKGFVRLPSKGILSESCSTIMLFVLPESGNLDAYNLKSPKGSK